MLVICGDPGVGKTTQLEAAVSDASEFNVLQLVAIESEMRIGFAALHALLRPLLDGVDGLPPRQARALRTAFGVEGDGVTDPLLVGLAVLTLVSEAASSQPMLIAVDDAQWLDQESMDVVSFVARRLLADHVGMLIAVRGPIVPRPLDGLPRVDLLSLPDRHARALVDQSAGAPIAVQVRDRIISEARGNPLALVELVRDLSPAQRAGVAELPDPFHVDQRLEERFVRQVRSLPRATQQLLLTAAADPTGDISLVLRAGGQLDFDEGALGAAATADLLTEEPTLSFRHSVIRSAVYQSATEPERRRVHAALAAATDVEHDPDRRAWHLAAASAVPNEEIADDLERAANRSQSHGRYAATAAFLERAAELTPDRGRRALRRLFAAAAALTAGNSAHAREIVSRAIPDLDDVVVAAQARRIEAAAMFLELFLDAAGDSVPAGRQEQIMSLMLEAVSVVAPIDIHGAREILLDAIPMGVYFAGPAPANVQTPSRVALSLPLPIEAVPTTTDLVLDSLATLFVHGFERATDGLRQCLAAIKADSGLRDMPRTMALGCWVAFALGDDEALIALAGDLETICRDRGAYQILPEVLSYLGQYELRRGSLARADAYFAEEREIEALSGREMQAEVVQLLVAAWRGRETEVRSASLPLSERVSALRVGLASAWVEYSLLLLDLGIGDYAAAARRQPGDPANDVALGAFKAADEVEAQVRGGDAEVAAVRVAWMSERALATGAPLELGLSARCRALLARDEEAEAYFQESVAYLVTAGSGLHLARTRLLYGEWLRRQKRRRDARAELDAALATFESAGANAFANRTRAELRATGAKARQRVDETRNDLTPQEEQIARLAAEGATNPEIAGRLFISAKTVEYHLKKVYRKLGINTRRELSRVLVASD